MQLTRLIDVLEVSVARIIGQLNFLDVPPFSARRLKHS